MPLAPTIKSTVDASDMVPPASEHRTASALKSSDTQHQSDQSILRQRTMPADPQIVYKGSGGGSHSTGNLFAGKTFWLSKAVPQRSHFSDLLKVGIGSRIDSRQQLK